MHEKIDFEKYKNDTHALMGGIIKAAQFLAVSILRFWFRVENYEKTTLLDFASYDRLYYLFLVLQMLILFGIRV